jgi:hypothetical protein
MSTALPKAETLRFAQASRAVRSAGDNSSARRPLAMSGRPQQSRTLPRCRRGGRGRWRERRAIPRRPRDASADGRTPGRRWPPPRSCRRQTDGSDPRASSGPVAGSVSLPTPVAA